MQLSKSKYTQGMQCPKMLWMRKNMPEQFDESVLNDGVLQTGNEVGDLAMGYFGDFVEIPFERSGFESMAKRTQELIEAGVPTICEATFIHEGNLCMVDLLRVFDGYVELVEVKSSTGSKETYLHDIAYQVWLLRQCGLDVRKASLMHINNKYVRGEELDIHQLFTLEDLTEQIEKLVVSVPTNIEKINNVAEQTDEPCRSIGMHCFKPYECGFRQWCWREVPSPSVFDLYRMKKEKALGYHLGGISSFEDLVATGTINDFSDRQQLQILCEIEDKVHIDGNAVADFLESLWYPLHFLDFETYQLAIPEYPGTKPYQQLTSQYSLHIIESEGSEVIHREFLAKEGQDPRRELAESLAEAIPGNACVLAWNMSFEKGRIKELAGAFPDLAPRLMAIHANIRDLMTPFLANAYYTKEMQGSASIKQVLPALFPDDPELDYHALEGVHNGGEASTAFKDLPKHTPEEREIIREQLLRYCELDTLAMVRIWQKLNEVAD